MQRKHLAAILLSTACLLGIMLFSAGAGSQNGRAQSPATTASGLHAAVEGDPAEGILGIVQHARFVRLGREQSAYTIPARLTTIQPWAAMSPHTQEIPLAPHEGRALMVTGMDQGEWIYSAQIVEVAGPILTAVTLRVFGPPGGESIPDPVGAEDEPVSCE